MESLVLSVFWKDKRVLLTGHTGFKGSWLALWLRSMGAEVFGFSLAPDTTPSLFEQLGLEQLISHTVGDIRDAEALSAHIDFCKADVVFHLAAQPLVLRGYQESPLTWGTNVMGTVNLLEGLRKAGRDCSVVVVTTDKVYENLETNHLYTEDDRLGGLDPYSASKAGTEMVAHSYRFVMGQEKLPIRLACARAGNVIGGGDWADNRLVPDILRAVANNQSVHTRNPQSVRPWQHVLEPLAGYIQLAENLSGDQPLETAFNFGPEPSDNRTVKDVIQTALKYWQGEFHEADVPNAPHEAGLLMLSVDKAKASLNWEPKWDFETTIAKTMEWYKLVHEGASPIEVTQRQISEFSQL